MEMMVPAMLANMNLKNCFIISINFMANLIIRINIERRITPVVI